MKRFGKTILVAALIFVLCTGCFGCRLFSGKYPIFTPTYGERAYVQPDEELQQRLNDELRALSLEEGREEELLEKRIDLFVQYYQVMTSQTIALIEYYKNTSDETAARRYEYITDYANRFFNDVLETEKILFESSYRDVLIGQTSEEYALSLADRDVKNQVVLELEQKETALVSEYASVYQTASSAEFARIYKDLVVTRNAIAAEFSDDDGNPYSNYHDYAYAELYFREYTPEDAFALRNELGEKIRPIADSLQQTRKTYFGEQNNAGFPAISENSLKGFAKYAVEQTVSEAAPSWNYMINHDLYDFSVSDTKMDTSFVCDFHEYGDGFMFINASGNLSDLDVVLHEFGHYNAIFAADDEKEGNVPFNLELAETFSQAFELITLPAIEKLLQKEGLSEYTSFYEYFVVDNSLYTLLSGSAFEDFEYTVYRTDPDLLTADYLENLFRTSLVNYWGSASCEYYEVPHFFESPAYYISYVVSRVFASIIWAEEDYAEKYLDVVSYGSTNTLETVASQTGLPSPFSDQAVDLIAEKYDSFIDVKFA